MEFFAAIGLVATVRTKPVRQVVSYAWSRYVGSSKQALPDFKVAQNLTKFHAGPTLALSAYAIRARAIAVQGRANLTSVLVAMKNRIKNPVVTTESSQTTVRSALNSSWVPYGPYFQRKSRKTSSAESNGSTPFSCQISQVNAQQNNLQQNNYGLFHWYSNGGRSEEWAQEFGKKKFWQGVAAGGFGMAWLMKPSADSSEEKRKKAA